MDGQQLLKDANEKEVELLQEPLTEEEFSLMTMFLGTWATFPSFLSPIEGSLFLKSFIMAYRVTREGLVNKEENRAAYESMEASSHSAQEVITKAILDLGMLIIRNALCGRTEDKTDERGFNTND